MFNQLQGTRSASYKEKLRVNFDKDASKTFDAFFDAMEQANAILSYLEKRSYPVNHKVLLTYSANQQQSAAATDLRKQDKPARLAINGLNQAAVVDKINVLLALTPSLNHLADIVDIVPICTMTYDQHGVAGTMSDLSQLKADLEYLKELSKQTKTGDSVTLINWGNQDGFDIGGGISAKHMTNEIQEMIDNAMVECFPASIGPVAIDKQGTSDAAKAQGFSFAENILQKLFARTIAYSSLPTVTINYSSVQYQFDLSDKKLQDDMEGYLVRAGISNVDNHHDTLRFPTDTLVKHFAGVIKSFYEAFQKSAPMEVRASSAAYDNIKAAYEKKGVNLCNTTVIRETGRLQFVFAEKDEGMQCSLAQKFLELANSRDNDIRSYEHEGAYYVVVPQKMLISHVDEIVASIPDLIESAKAFGAMSDGTYFKKAVPSSNNNLSENSNTIFAPAVSDEQLKPGSMSRELSSNEKASLGILTRRINSARWFCLDRGDNEGPQFILDLTGRLFHRFLGKKFQTKKNMYSVDPFEAVVIDFSDQSNEERFHEFKDNILMALEKHKPKKLASILGKLTIEIKLALSDGEKRIEQLYVSFAFEQPLRINGRTGRPTRKLLKKIKQLISIACEPLFGSAKHPLNLQSVTTLKGSLQSFENILGKPEKEKHLDSITDSVLGRMTQEELSSHSENFIASYATGSYSDLTVIASYTAASYSDLTAIDPEKYVNHVVEGLIQKSPTMLDGSIDFDSVIEEAKKALANNPPLTIDGRPDTNQIVENLYKHFTSDVSQPISQGHMSPPQSASMLGEAPRDDATKRLVDEVIGRFALTLVNRTGLGAAAIEAIIRSTVGFITTSDIDGDTLQNILESMRCDFIISARAQSQSGSGERPPKQGSLSVHGCRVFSPVIPQDDGADNPHPRERLGGAPKPPKGP